MAQIRVEKATNFTHLENKLLQNSNLSLKARGLLAYMLSLPEDWNYSIEGLSVTCREGKTAIRSAINELIAEGYVVRHLARGEKGILNGYEYTVYEIPQQSCGNRTTVDRTSENRTEQNNKEQNNQETKPPIVPQGRGEETAEIKSRLSEYAGEDRELLAAIYGLLENRRVANKKPVKTLRALNGILKELDRLSGGDREQKLALLEHATLCNWLTVYPLRENRPRVPEPEEAESDVVW